MPYNFFDTTSNSGDVEGTLEEFKAFREQTVADVEGILRDTYLRKEEARVASRDLCDFNDSSDSEYYYSDSEVDEKEDMQQSAEWHLHETFPEWGDMGLDERENRDLAVTVPVGDLIRNAFEAFEEKDVKEALADDISKAKAPISKPWILEEEELSDSSKPRPF